MRKYVRLCSKIFEPAQPPMRLLEHVQFLHSPRRAPKKCNFPLCYPHSSLNRELFCLSISANAVFFHMKSTNKGGTTIARCGLLNIPVFFMSPKTMRRQSFLLMKSHSKLQHLTTSGHRELGNNNVNEFFHV